MCKGKFSILRVIVAILVATIALVSNLDIVNCDPRIVGGYEATFNNTKHQLSLRLKYADIYTFGNGHICGASLISNSRVLTASHCLYTSSGSIRSASEFIVVGGTLNRFIQDNNTIIRYVTNLISHAHYNQSTFENDIALLFLDEAISADHPTVQPIQLRKTKAMDGINCTVNGWGTTSYSGEPTVTLLSVDVNIINILSCNTSYHGELTAGMMCAGVTGGGKDACQGDSGGPLACNGLLTGVVSNGYECALPNYPGIYTDVYKFKKWINSNGTDYSGPTNIPYQVSIRLMDDDDTYKHIGSGVIINDKQIISTASCLMQYWNQNLSNFRIVAGSIDLLDDEGTTFLNVTKIKIHDEFTNTSLDYDLAILTVASSIQFDDETVSNISLHKTSVPVNTICTVSSWGTLASGNYSSSLEISETTILEDSICVAKSSVFTLSNYTICTLLSENNTCSGNSGSPLVYDNKLAGLLIRESGCLHVDTPVIYSDLHSHLKWIEDNSNKGNILQSSMLLSLILSITIIIF